MSGGELERRYRRLLACYPAGFRRMYEHEMIGVLLAAGRGRSRPGVADALNLLAGAARARLGTLAAGRTDPGWRDALAVTSLLAPFLLGVLLLGQDLGWMAGLAWHNWNGTAGPLVPLWPAGLLLVPVALGLAGLRRTACGAAVVLAAWVTVQAAIGQRLDEPRFAGYLMLLAVQAVALAASPGPRHALRLTTRRGVAAALPWLAITAYAAKIIPGHYPVPLPVAEAGTAVIAAWALLALASPQARRVLVLLVLIPGSAFAASLLTFASVSFPAMSFAAGQAALYLPPAGLATLTLVAMLRSAGRKAQETRL